ncbi:MAG TPA: LytTR family DNA-binding domain-containing protein [Chitinophagales bacterium]|nr:LytTR family DNA-binding domain-containing protein [Chitinophagales bacterium]
MRYTFLLLCLIIGLDLFAQTPQADKLKEILQNQNLEDTAKISYYQQLAQSIVQTAPDSGLKYAMLGFELAKQKNAVKDQMIFYKIMSIGQATKGDYATAKETVNKGIELYKNADQKQALGDLYHNLGIINYRLQDFENSITAYQKSLDISGTLNNNTAFVKTKVSMLSLYVDIKKFDKALQLGNELVDYVKEKMPNDKIVLGKAYQNIGYAYWRSGNLDSAMLNNKKAYSIHKPINHYDGLINELGTFAQYFTIKNQYAKSIEYLNESLIYSNKIGHAETQCRTSILLSDNYTKLNDLVNAKKYADSAVVIADRTQLKNLQKSAYDNVAKLSAAQADYEKAYKVRVISDSLQTKIVKIQNIEHAQELDVEYDVKEKQNIINDQKAAIKTHKNLNILLFILGAISLIVGYFIYTYINKQAQNAKLKAQQLAMQLNETWKKYEQLNENQSVETREILVENEQSTPINLDSNEQQQEKIIQQHSENNTYIEFKEDREIKKIAYTAIYYIKSGKNYQEFFDKSDKRIGMILLPLSNLHQLLPENFCRVQKSYIVNKNYLAEKKIIKRGKKEFVILSNDVEIPFSDKFDEIDGFPLL